MRRTTGPGPVRRALALRARELPDGRLRALEDRFSEPPREPDRELPLPLALRDRDRDEEDVRVAML
jgi:hypothetical protein